MSTTSNDNDLIAVVEGLIEAYNAQDFDRYRTFLDDRFYFLHHNRGWEADDADFFVNGLRTVPKAVPDRTLGPATRIVQSGNIVVREQPWRGTALEDLDGGMAKKGEKFSLDFCSVFVFNGTLIAEYHEYG